MKTPFPAPVLASPQALDKLLQLFTDRADELRFPGVDAETLLAGLAHIEAQQAAVRGAEAALAQAREDLAQAEQDLLGQALKAHAYATIYAAGDEVLAAELAEASLSVSEAVPRKRRAAASRPTEFAVSSPAVSSPAVSSPAVSSPAVSPPAVSSPAVSSPAVSPPASIAVSSPDENSGRTPSKTRTDVAAE